MACDVVEMLAAASGTSASADGQRMQRYLRDVMVYARTSTRSRAWAADVGAVLLGGGVPRDQDGPAAARMISDVSAVSEPGRNG